MRAPMRARVRARMLSCNSQPQCSHSRFTLPELDVTVGELSTGGDVSVIPASAYDCGLITTSA